MSDRAVTVNPVGSPGLSIFGGRVYDEWDRRLQGKRALETYRRMVDDAAISSATAALKAMIIAAGHHLDPADESDDAKDGAQFVSDAITEMDGSWSHTLANMLTCIEYGFSLLEVAYKLRDDSRFRFGWKSWSPRSQVTIDEWVFDPVTREATAAIQVAYPDYARKTIPLEPTPEHPGGCLHVRIWPSNQNPMGTSLLRACYESWYARREIGRLEGIGIERDFTGVPEIGIPAEDYNDATARGNWQEVGSKFYANESSYMLLPTDVYAGTNVPRYHFKLVSSPGERTIDTGAVQERHKRDILGVFSAQVMGLGATSVGSYALGTTQADFMVMGVKAILESIQDTIQIAVDRLCLLNGIARELIPRFVFGEVERRNVKEFAETIVALATAGLVDADDPELRKHVAKFMGYPTIDEVSDDETGDGETDAAPAAGPAMPIADLGPYLVDLKQAGLLVDTPKLRAYLMERGGLPVPEVAEITRILEAEEAKRIAERETEERALAALTKQRESAADWRRSTIGEDGAVTATDPLRFIEQTDAANERARKAWRESVGDDVFADLIDAEASE